MDVLRVVINGQDGVRICQDLLQEVDLVEDSIDFYLLERAEAVLQSKVYWEPLVRANVGNLQQVIIQL